jgi:ADP-ribosylglycohydrolase
MRFALNISSMCPQGSVPQSITAFLKSENYEDAVRKAIPLGGDADTMACIAGGIAEAFYGPIPEDITLETRKSLPNKFLKIIDEFYGVIRE